MIFNTLDGDKYKQFVTACNNNLLFLVRYLIDNNYIDPLYNNNHALLSFIAHDNINGVKYIVEAIKQKYTALQIKSFISDDQHKTILDAPSSRNLDNFNYFVDTGIIDIYRMTTEEFACFHCYALEDDDVQMAKHIYLIRADCVKKKRYLADAWINGHMNTIKYVIDNDLDTGIYQTEIKPCNGNSEEEEQVATPNFEPIIHKFYMYDILYYLYDSGMFETAIKIVNNCIPISKYDIFEIKYESNLDIFETTYISENDDEYTISKPPRYALPNNNIPIEIKYGKYMCPIKEEIASSLKLIAKSRLSFHANLRNISNVTIITQSDKN